MKTAGGRLLRDVFRLGIGTMLFALVSAFVHSCFASFFFFDMLTWCS